MRWRAIWRRLAGMDEIYLMVFQHGIISPSLAPVARWQAVLRQCDVGAHASG